MKKEKFLRSLRKTGDSLSVTVPSEIVKVLKLKENDLIRVEVEKVEEK